MPEDLKIVVVPKELYYHEVAYVRGLETAARAMLAALHESAMANEKAFHDLAIYAGVDTIAPPEWFRSKFARLIEATRQARAAIAQAEAAGIKTEG
jgi:hypothetical protein